MSALFTNTKQDLVVHQKTGKGYSFELCFTNIIGDGDYKRDCISTRSYTSQKYKNLTELNLDVNEVKFYNTKNYFTINYNCFDKSQKSESLYVSYPNLLDLTEFLEDMFNIVNGDVYFTSSNALKPGASEAVVTSADFAFGKLLEATPHAIRIDDNNVTERGVALYIVNPTDNNGTCVILSEREVYNIYSRFKSLDANTLSIQCSLLFNGSVEYITSTVSLPSDDEIANSRQPYAPPRRTVSRATATPSPRRSATPAPRRSATPAPSTEVEATPSPRRTRGSNFTPQPIEDLNTGASIEEKTEVVKTENVDFETKPRSRGTKLSFGDIAEEAKNHNYKEDTQMDYSEDDNGIEFDE